MQYAVWKLGKATTTPSQATTDETKSGSPPSPRCVGPAARHQCDVVCVLCGSRTQVRVLQDGGGVLIEFRAAGSDKPKRVDLTGHTGVLGEFPTWCTTYIQAKDKKTTKMECDLDNGQWKFTLLPCTTEHNKNKHQLKWLYGTVKGVVCAD